jgi:hypothetical protein
VGRFKKYQATIGNMIAKRDIRTYSSVAMNFKGNLTKPRTGAPALALYA